VPTVLIQPPSPKPPPTYFGPPYGLAMVAACLREAGLKVRCHDLDRVAPDDLRGRLMEILKADRPRFLGLSCGSASRGAVYELIRAARACAPKLTIVVGGPFASLEPELILENFPADFVVIGEGERTFPELVATLKKGGDPDSVPGVAFRRGGKTRRSAPRPPCPDLDALPFPAFDLFDFKPQLAAFQGIPEARFAPAGFVRENRLDLLRSGLTLLGSRGCPFSCVFCPQSAVRGPHKLRAHSPERFVDIVAHFRRSAGVRRFIFGDNYFTFDRERALAICAGLLRRKLDIEWICMTRPDSVDPGLLAKMREAGCIEISYGVESGSPAIQKAIGKYLRLAEVAPCFAATRAAGIASVLMLMVGNPGECEATLLETLACAQPLRPDRVLVKTTKVYPGTRMHDLAVKQGLIPDGYYAGSDPHPPRFTAEHDLAGLRALKGMLRPREAFVDLPAGERAAKAALLLAARRSELVTLGGAEPLERRHEDLARALSAARRLEIHHLALRSGAFAAVAARAADLRANGVEELLLPWEAPALPAAAAWKAAGGRVRAQVPLREADFRDLPRLVRGLTEAGVDESVFFCGRSPDGWSQVAWADCPRMSDLVPRVSDALAALRAAGAAAFLSGIPACIAGTRPERLYEVHRPFDEKIAAGGKLVALPAERETLKLKTEVCRSCPRSPVCEGLWKGYAERYGAGELHAL